MKWYYEKLYSSKFENLNEIDKFMEKYKMQKYI